MSIVDEIAEAILYERDPEAWDGARAMTPARKAEEVRLFPQASKVCRSCRRRHHIADLMVCPECGAWLCKDCDPTCPHRRTR